MTIHRDGRHPWDREPEPHVPTVRDDLLSRFMRDCLAELGVTQIHGEIDDCSYAMGRVMTLDEQAEQWFAESILYDRHTNKCDYAENEAHVLSSYASAIEAEFDLTTTQTWLS